MGTSKEWIEENRKKKWDESHKIIDGVDHKECNRCFEHLPSTIDYFYKNDKNGIDGLYPYCKECTKTKNIKWAKENNDKTRGYLKKHNAKPERKKMTYDHGVSARERGLRREWFRNNKDKVKIYNATHNNHKISEREWEGCLEYFNWSCAYCEYTYDEHTKEHGQQLHRDHVNHNGNDYIDNCIPACRTCNTSKHDHDFNIWYSEGNPNYSKRRSNRIIKWVESDWMEWTE